MTTPTPSRHHARWAVVASRFNEVATDALVEGALDCFHRRGVPAGDVDVVRVAGAFEVPQAVARLLTPPHPRGRGPVVGVVALAAVIRGETPHFDYICQAVAHGLMDIALRTGAPVGFGVLTCDTLEQALARAGGDRGNKGFEAAAAALDLAAALPRHEA